MNRRSWPGLILIIVGSVLLLARQQLIRGDLTVLLIGTLFLAAYAFLGHYGLLVPGGIMTGLGAGIAVRDLAGSRGAPVLIGLGAGFMLIYVVDRLRGRVWEGGWWPLVPGGILVAIGLLQAARASGALQAIATWWQAVLILLGVWLLFRPKATTQPPPTG